MYQKFLWLVKRRLALLLVCLVLSPAVFAQTWKWLDSAGRTRYSDIPPPPDILPENILQTPSAFKSPTIKANPASKRAELLDKVAEEKRKKQEEEEKKKRAEEEAIAKKNREIEASNKSLCEAANRYKKVLESGKRLRKLNDKGEQIYLSDTERKSELERATTVASKACKS